MASRSSIYGSREKVNEYYTDEEEFGDSEDAEYMTDEEEFGGDSEEELGDSEEVIHPIPPDVIVKWNVLQYSTIKQIGTGTFGEIILVNRKRDNAKLAIKRIAKISNVEKIGALPKEYVIMRELRDHPNIAQVYGIEEDNEYFYIIMEYYEGGDLFSYVNNKRLSEQAIFHVIRQLVSTVKYCHIHNVTHRDIKLENIFIRNKPSKSASVYLPNIVLADFGFASIRPINQLLYDFPGSPAYAAPELVKADPYYGDKSDIWSIGVVLYILFMGDYPFFSQNTAKLFKQITEDDPPIYGSNISERCTKLLKLLLIKDPKKRPTISEIENSPCYA
jgi:calcium-dependent protein kinase